MQIGTVFASEEYVCPNAVGVDIGCGMCAVPVDGLHKDDLSWDDKLQLQGLIKVHGGIFEIYGCHFAALRLVLQLRVSWKGLLA